MKTRLLSAVLLAALVPAATSAAGPSTLGTVAVDGTVGTGCYGGDVNGGNSVFALGVMIDTATGLLLNNLSAPPKTVTGAFCNAASTITVTATPMVPSGFTGAPPAGFSAAVDYTTTASGWTSAPAVYATN